MSHRFETRFGTVEWEADGSGIQLTFRRRTERIPWQEITAAGLVHFSAAAVPGNFPTGLLPGLGKLIDLNRRMAHDQRQLVLARGTNARRAVRIPMLVADAAAGALVDAVHAGVGDRWIGEVPIEDHYAALGITTPWWSYPLIALGLAFFGLTLLLAIASFAALSGGQWADVPVVGWLALVAWLLLAGGILFLYRKRG